MYPESPTTDDLEQAYQAALRILYRLLFVAYAEDRGLLPLNASRSYREHSLKRIAQRLGEARRKDIEFGEQPSFWSEVAQIWTAVNLGNPEWEVPAYNGTLFASEASVSKLGARIAALSLPDGEFAGALAALLLDRTAEGTEGPVDFRSLGIREFGTIYEGPAGKRAFARRDGPDGGRQDRGLPPGQARQHGGSSRGRSVPAQPLGSAEVHGVLLHPGLRRRTSPRPGARTGARGAHRTARWNARPRGGTAVLRVPGRRHRDGLRPLPGRRGGPDRTSSRQLSGRTCAAGRSRRVRAAPPHRGRGTWAGLVRGPHRGHPAASQAGGPALHLRGGT